MRSRTDTNYAENAEKNALFWGLPVVKKLVYTNGATQHYILQEVAAAKVANSVKCR
jgi:hypothetical protein